MTAFRRYFFTGLAVVLPTVVSFYILYVVGEKLDKILGSEFRGEWIRPGGVPGLGLLSLCLIIILIGFFTSRTLGRRLVGLWERILVKIPVLNRLYVGAKQIAEAVFQNESRVFRRVVLIRFPRETTWALGFRTQRASAEIREKTGDNLVSIFLPTTPNPSSGYLLLVPEEEVIDLGMSVEEGLKLVISAGSVVPPGATGALAPAASVAVAPAPDDDPKSRERKKRRRG